MLAQKLLSGGWAETLYVDDVFQSYVRDGTGADVTVTTGIDMTKGYMLWSKGRSGATDHAIYDSARGVTLDLVSNSTAAQTTQTTGLKSVSATGHTVGSLAKMNTSSATYVDFVFRKAPKFFDVVTYTGNGVAGRQIPHSLGVAPGMIIVKCTSNTNAWAVYHRSVGGGKALFLNETGTGNQISVYWNNTNPTDSVFTVGTDTAVNESGLTYVAYLFAHDTSTDGIIQCGSFTTDGSGNATVNLGWEPQYVMVKASSATSSWYVFDSARGMGVDTLKAYPLMANNSGAESINWSCKPSATGVSFDNNTCAVSTTHIYTVIRRPNKPPTSGTQVYNAIARTGTGAAATVTGVGFAPDLVCSQNRSGDCCAWHDRLRGVGHLRSDNTSSTSPSTQEVKSYTNDGVTLGTSDYGVTNFSGAPYINHFFRRAVGCFDQVCYTGTGVAKTEAHNLGVVPELMICKTRGTSNPWVVWCKHFSYLSGTAGSDNCTGYLSQTNAFNGYSESDSINALPTASMFSLGTQVVWNGNTNTAVMYLFATKAGISCVTNYTGNGGAADSAGSSQTINCGFTTGSRFVMIKCTSHTSDWIIVDTVRGLVAGNDPTLSLNTTAAEVTGQDLLDPASEGFVVNQLGSGAGTSANFNVTGRTYIVLSFA